MSDDIGFVAGCLLLCVICSWAVCSLAAQFRLNVKSKTAVDQTLSEVDKDDAPGMFFVQIIGFILLIGASALIGIGALAAMIQRLVGVS